MTERGRRELAVCVGAAILATYAAATLLSDHRVQRLVLDENGVLQLGGAIAFLVAGGLFLAAYRRGRRRWYLVFAAAFLIAAGEEAGWGQHLFGFDNPNVIDSNNAQDRLTAHNLDFFQDVKRAAGIDLLFAGFLLFALTYLVVIPYLARSQAARRRLERWIPVEPEVFGMLLLGNLVLYMCASLLPVMAEGRDVPTEVAETGCALIFVAVAVNAAGAGRGVEQTRQRFRLRGLWSTAR